jgi:hypothetical protein
MILDFVVQVVGTAGYAAPEYIQTGHLTVKSDVWSFGIVMLEVLTGRKVMDRNRPKNEQRLVEWAKPYINDHHKIFQIVDPFLKGRYPARPAQKFAQLAYQCLSKFPKSRPKMSDVVEKLKIVQEKTYQWESPSAHSPSSLSLPGEISRSTKDSPRGLTLGSLPIVRSGKASNYSPNIGHSADDSRQIPNLSLRGSSHGLSRSTKSVSMSGAEPKPVDSSAEKPELVPIVVEEPKPVDPNPVVSSAEKPELVVTLLEEPKPVDPNPVDANPVYSSSEKPELVATVVKEPKSMDTKLMDSIVEKAESVDSSAEKPKLVETVEEEPKPIYTVVEEPKLVSILMENSSSEVVKRRSWGSDRLARMSRESGRFTWIPKLSFSIRSTS